MTYGRFFAMIVTPAVVMFEVMYLNPGVSEALCMRLRADGPGGRRPAR
jgi:hypothetical protein